MVRGIYMKVKHYLSKAQRKELEDIINYWDSKNFTAHLNNNDYSAMIATENFYMYIEYVNWCGFKVDYDIKQKKFIIIK